MEIKHFDHKHLLWRMYMTRYDLIRCKACSSLCDGQAYVCGRLFCNYALHESCAKLPKKIQSPYHTDHPLLQRSNISTSGNCNGCGNKSSGFIFRCNDDRCKFYLDLDCTFKKPLRAIEEGGGKHRTHLNHHHPLLRFQNVPNRNFGCSICGELFMYRPLYGCFPCLLFMHRSCFKMKLLPEIKHFDHLHPLTLCTKESSLTCWACNDESTMVWYYNCKECDDFKMHIACALSLSAFPNKINFEKKKINHFLHDHPLQSKPQVDDGKVVNCCVCGKGSTSPTTTTYVCAKAFTSSYCKNNIYFHKSCLEFPQQIFHPFHPYHPLTLKLSSLSHGDRAQGNCKACRKPPYEFTHNPTNDIIAYICESHNCDILLHVECVMLPSIAYEVECSVMKPLLAFKSHNSHLLHIRDDNIENSKLQCGACKSYINESYAFTCLYCDLNLHIRCGPIPREIIHKDHIHPLFLTNSPVEEELEDETDEFYCNVCEEERDLLLPVYHCANCRFVAEFKCVLSQIILSLKGKYGDTELRSTLGQLGNLISANAAKEMCQNKFEKVWQTSNCYHILGPSREDVIVELSDVSRAMRTTATEEDGIYKDSECPETFLFRDEAYTQFMRFLDSGKGILDILENPGKFAVVKEGKFAEVKEGKFAKEVFVKVGEYMVPLRLANILEQLLSRHGDVSAESKLSTKAKLYLSIVLCECMYSMTNTRVVDITEDLLLYWWTSLRMLQTAGFKIQFAFDHLKRVADAYFGLYVKKRVKIFDEVLFEQHKDLQNLQNKIEALEKTREGIRSVESAKSNLIEKCMREATILKHAIASTGLIRI